MSDLGQDGGARDGDVLPHITTAEDVNPPRPGDPGFEDYAARLSQWRQSIAERAASLPETSLGPTPYFDAESGRKVTAADQASEVVPAPYITDLDVDSEPAPGEEDDGDLRRRTDASNGEYFAHLHGQVVRFDHRRRRWLVWGRHWWRDDDTELVRRLAKEAARQRYQDALVIEDLDERSQESRFAIRSENKYRLDAMLIQARSEPPIADAGDRWDGDPYLLGVANGVVDLRTGHLRRGVPDDRITLHTDVPFDPEATCPRWDRFANEIFDGDAELVAFLQRAFGYSLTGDVTEQCLFLCHGTGAKPSSTVADMRTGPPLARRAPGMPYRQSLLHGFFGCGAVGDERLLEDQVGVIVVDHGITGALCGVGPEAGPDRDRRRVAGSGDLHPSQAVAGFGSGAEVDAQALAVVADLKALPAGRHRIDDGIVGLGVRRRWHVLGFVRDSRVGQREEADEDDWDAPFHGHDLHRGRPVASGLRTARRGVEQAGVWGCRWTLYMRKQLPYRVGAGGAKARSSGRATSRACGSWPQPWGRPLPGQSQR